MNARFSISDFRSKIPVTASHVRKSSFSWIAMNGDSSLLVKRINLIDCVSAGSVWDLSLIGLIWFGRLIFLTSIGRYAELR